MQLSCDSQPVVNFLTADNLSQGSKSEDACLQQKSGDFSSATILNSSMLIVKHQAVGRHRGFLLLSCCEEPGVPSDADAGQQVSK